MTFKMKLAFYKAAGDRYDQLIRLVTHGPYSHCELVFENNDWFSSSPRDGGVRVKQINYDPATWDLVEIDLPGRPIKEWCATQLGLGYDWAGVTRFVVPFVKPAKNKWFCSEICIAALQQVNFFTKLPPSQFSPNALYQAVSLTD